jgi:CTP:molybdopterin cytidylyltransferase MocA
MSRVAAVVLAAGEASRFGSPKQLILLPRVLERLRETSVDEIVVVEGAYELDHQTEARIVRCADWERGPGASLRCGVEALGAEVEAALVVLADGPNLAPEAVERVLTEWGKTGGIVAASYGGGRGHPLVLSRADWADIPNEGLRDRAVTLVPCDDLGPPGDVDTEEDLSAL